MYICVLVLFFVYALLAANPRTKDLDLRGLDSSRSSLARVGLPPSGSDSPKQSRLWIPCPVGSQYFSLFSNFFKPNQILMIIHSLDVISVGSQYADWPREQLGLRDSAALRDVALTY